MTTSEIANRLVELCRKGDFTACYQELYSPNVQSIEADGSSVTGFDGIAAKGKEWNEGIQEWHGAEIGDPIVSGNFFSLPMSMTLTRKGESGPSVFQEMCVYQVQEGKVVKEQFFYDDPTTAG